MNLSEKLNLLWKYLLLLVIVWGVYGHTKNSHHSFRGHGNMQGMHEMKMMGGHGGMKWSGHGYMTNVRIEKKIVDGDTTLIAFVNGEEIEVDKMSIEDGIHVIITKDGKTIKMGGGKGGHKHMRSHKEMDKD